MNLRDRGNEGRGVAYLNHLEEHQWVEDDPNNEGECETHAEEVIATSVDIHLLLFEGDAATDLEQLTNDVIEIVENE